MMATGHLSLESEYDFAEQQHAASLLCTISLSLSFAHILSVTLACLPQCYGISSPQTIKIERTSDFDTTSLVSVCAIQATQRFF